MTLREFALHFDHTLLKPDATLAQIEALCREAIAHSVATVCVNPVFVPLATGLLQGSSVKCCTVAGFPLGASVAKAKAHEADLAIRDGAGEVDMVIWIGGLKAGRLREVREEIALLASVCHGGRAILKVIIECALLSEAEMSTATKLCVDGGADFVKTSTGFAASGARVEDVRVLAKIARPAGLSVKAAGGIRSFTDATAMIEAGAARIGASATVEILAQARAHGLQ